MRADTAFDFVLSTVATVAVTEKKTMVLVVSEETEELVPAIVALSVQGPPAAAAEYNL